MPVNNIAQENQNLNINEVPSLSFFMWWWDWEQEEGDFTYNDSSNRIHPIINIIGKEYSNEANDVCNNIKKVILGVSLDYLIGERAAINSQKQFYQRNWKHNSNNPPLLLFGQVELVLLIGSLKS